MNILYPMMNDLVLTMYITPANTNTLNVINTETFMNLL